MHRDSPLLAQILSRSPRLRAVADRAEEHRLQILLSIERPEGTLESHGFRVDAEYFYPASTIKLIAALAAMETLERLAREHGVPISPDTPMVIHPCLADQVIEDRDDSHVAGPAAGSITVGHEIHKLALVSDNPAHNRLLALVGHRGLNDYATTALGLSSARLMHRLSDPRTLEENQRTPRVDLRTPTGVVTVPARESGLALDNSGTPRLEVGEAHIVEGRRVPGPMSFLHKNRVGLADLHRLIVLTARRERPIAAPSWDRLHEAMTMYPRQSADPVYAPAEYPDHFVKFLLPGLRRLGLPTDPVILNKVGQAYGFTTENARVSSPGRATFYLTATLYANASGVMNADTYDDKAVAEPFMADLGEAIARTVWS